MVSIYFIRHGESQSNTFIHNNPNDPDLTEKLNKHADPKLSELGRKQAISIGEYLSKTLDGNNVRVLTSLFKRTIKTSTPFWHFYHDKITEYEKSDLLAEYTRPQKKLTEKQLNNGLKHHMEWKDFTQQLEQFVEMLEKMCLSDDTTPIVIFGHSIFLSALVSYIGSNKTRMPEKDDLVFRFPNCSITKLSYRDKKWRIFKVACIGHLPEELHSGVEKDFGSL